MDIIEWKMTEAEFARMNAGLMEHSESGLGQALEIEGRAAIQGQIDRGYQGDIREELSSAWRLTNMQSKYGCHGGVSWTYSITT
jgi:hypothetical protein